MNFLLNLASVPLGAVKNEFKYHSTGDSVTVDHHVQLVEPLKRIFLLSDK
jgi:hypothetical protein